MSESNFKVSPEALRAAADDYFKQSINVARAMEHYAKAIQRLFQDFSGVTAIAMSGKLVELTRNLAVSGYRIIETQDELKDSAGIYEEAERANEQLMQELQSGSAYS